MPKKTPLLTKKVRLALSAAQQANFKKLEKQLAENAASKNASGGTDTILGGRGADMPEDNSRNGDPADFHVWMHEVVEDDNETAAQKFSLLKRKYNFKKRKNQTTIEEDAAYLRAEKLERARLKRLDVQPEITIINGEGEDLFVSPDLPAQISLKRPYAATIDSGNDEDDFLGSGGIPSMTNKRTKNNPSRKRLDKKIVNES